MKTISFINNSTVGYGAYETTMHYIHEANKRGYNAKLNHIGDDVDLYIIGMIDKELRDGIQDKLKHTKFIYIEHSIECLIFEKTWIRNFLMPNSIRNYFFSPRHQEHIRDGLKKEDKHLAEDNTGLLVVPVDYNLFRHNSDIKRIPNLYI